jgi:hypothetical protein
MITLDLATTIINKRGITDNQKYHKQYTNIIFVRRG